MCVLGQKKKMVDSNPLREREGFIPEVNLRDKQNKINCVTHEPL